MQIKAFIPCLAAAKATPCAWFPAEQAITPLIFPRRKAVKFYSMHRAL